MILLPATLEEEDLGAIRRNLGEMVLIDEVARSRRSPVSVPVPAVAPAQYSSNTDKETTAVTHICHMQGPLILSLA